MFEKIPMARFKDALVKVHDEWEFLPPSLGNVVPMNLGPRCRWERDDIILEIKPQGIYVYLDDCFLSKATS